MPLVEKFQKCCQVRFGLVKRCWGTWSSPGLPRAWKSWPTIPGANAHNFTKSWWKPHGKMKDNKNGSQANYQFLGVISPDIVGGVLFFQGRPFRQNKGRLGPLSLYHGRLPLPGFGSINRFAIQKKKTEHGTWNKMDLSKGDSHFNLFFGRGSISISGVLNLDIISQSAWTSWAQVRTAKSKLHRECQLCWIRCQVLLVGP